MGKKFELRSYGKLKNSGEEKTLKQVQGDIKNSLSLRERVRVRGQNQQPSQPMHVNETLSRGEGRVGVHSAFTLAEGATHVVSPPAKAKFAFTLAEVLITLGVIGVVAAMTIPGLITEHQKRATVTKLQRAISVLNQAYKLSFDDLGEPSADEAFQMGAEEYFNTYWAPYIKTAHICKTYSDCGYKSPAPWLLTNKQKSGTYVVSPNARTTFYTADGFLYVIFTAQGDSSSPTGLSKLSTVIIDINGSANPNKYGRDVFLLTRVEKDGGGIQPYGYNLSDSSINNSCSSEGNGTYCAEKIRRSGWKIQKNYPWK